MSNSLSNNTIKTYEYVFNHYVNNKYLLNPKKMIKHFNNLFLSDDTIRLCISSILNYLKNNKELLKELNGNELNKIMEEYHNILMEIKDKTEKELENHDNIKQEFIPEFNDIIKIRDNYLNNINNNNLSNNKKLINYRKYLCSSLFTLHPPRRELDYSSMLIMNNMNDYNKYISKFINIDNLPYYYNEDNNKDNFNLTKDKKINNNFYIKDLGLFIFWNYKTYKTYKVQIIKVNKELNDIIKEYIKVNNLKSGDLLFKGKNFHLLINETFKSPIYDNKPISINALRHSYIINFYNNTKGNDIINNIDELSKMMGHSIKMNMNYYKNK